jgi:hypothetical protein
LLNLETSAIINSRDIIWLKKMHKDWLKNKLMTIIEEKVVVDLATSNTTLNVDEISKKNANNRVVEEMEKLESWLNPQAIRL